jgi:two-component system response regulator FixJ
MDGPGSFLFVINDDPDARDLWNPLALSIGVPCKLFSSAEDFLEHFSRSLAGCLLVNLHLKGMSGLELQQVLTAQSSSLPIVFVGRRVAVATAVRAMQDGASTVLEEPFRADELIEAIRHGLETNRKAREVAARVAEVRRRLKMLAVQESRLVEMIVEGAPNKCIMRVFGVSQRTIARLRAKVYQKMGVESTFDLTKMMAESGALQPVDNGPKHFLTSGRPAISLASTGEAARI